MASTVAKDQALQGRHLTASYALADDLGVADQASSNKHGWSSSTLNTVLGQLVGRLDVVSNSTGSINTALGLTESPATDGLVSLSWGSTNYINADNNMRQGILALDAYINHGFVTRIGLVSGSNGSFGTNGFAQPANAKFAADATYKAAIEALHTYHIDVSSSVANILLGADVNLNQFTEVVTAYTNMSSSLNFDLADLQAVIGVGDAANLGAFDGGTIIDNRTVKQAFQALETAVEGNDTDITALQTLSGVGDEDVNLGEFAGGTVISNNLTVKAALGELDAHASNTRPDFRAALASGAPGAVGAEYVVGFAAGAPQIRLVERTDGAVDVYYEIR
jgi:hypothetical protein